MKQNKQTIRLNENQLRNIIKETILNEIGDTPKGQYALGALAASRLKGKRKGDWQEPSWKAWDERDKASEQAAKLGKDDSLKAAHAAYTTRSEMGDAYSNGFKSINESQLRQMLKEALNEIGDTPKGQYALGALHAKKVYNNSRINYKKTGELAHNPTPDEKEVYNYAKKKRGGNNDMETAYANGYIKQRDKENSKGINESKLNNIIKESVKKVLKENYQMDDWRMGNWRTFPMPEPDDKFSVVLLNRNNNIVRETAKYFKNVKDAYDYYKMITRQTPKQDAVMFRKPQHAGEPWIRVRTSNKI